jgi:alpha-glucosidase
LRSERQDIDNRRLRPNEVASELKTRRSVLAGLGAVTASFAGARSHELSHNRSARAVLSATSPNRLLIAQIIIGESGGSALEWAVLYGKARVLEPSALGLTLSDGRVLGRTAELLGHSTSAVDCSWNPPYGIRTKVPDVCEELVVRLQDAGSGIAFDCIVRAYDGGAALRYVIRERAGGAELVLAGELTEFRLPRGSRVYASRDEGEY